MSAAPPPRKRLWDGVRLPHPRAEPLLVEKIRDIGTYLRQSYIGQTFYEPLASLSYNIAKMLVNAYDDYNDWWIAFYDKYIGPKGLYHRHFNTLYRWVWNATEFPFYLMDVYPWTTSAISMALIVLFIQYDTETDLLSVPFLPILYPDSKLGKLIQNGRRVRRALGGRTFAQYVRDKKKVGDQPPIRELFVEYYGDFVDETEFNRAYVMLLVMWLGTIFAILFIIITTDLIDIDQDQSIYDSLSLGSNPNTFIFVFIFNPYIPFLIPPPFFLSFLSYSYFTRDVAQETVEPLGPPPVTKSDEIDLKTAILRKAHMDMLDQRELQLRDSERAFYQTIANLESNPRDLVTGELIKPYKPAPPQSNNV